MNVLRIIENIRKDVLNFEDMFIESDMPDCFSRIYESENPTVSARELHEKLHIGTKFTTWFERMKEYGFSEGKEFFPKLGETSEQGGRPQTDFEISVDMAKQICMLQRSPEGKQIRQYFIDLEKAWNTPEQIFARALKMADKTIESLKTDIFDDEKILLIESLPECDSIIVIWFKLLCFAGKTNNSGVFLMGDSIPYTDGIHNSY